MPVCQKQGVAVNQEKCAEKRSAFRRILVREPTAEEQRLLQSSLDKLRKQFLQDRAAAAELVQVGEFPLPPQHDVVELAALTALCNLLLNLDETLTRE